MAISSRSRNSIDPDVVIRMRDILEHRGPDDSGMIIDGNIALAHRRLSIVDLSAGHQPLANEDGTIQIVFNGEIYNHADYRSPLEDRGHTFATHSDTEAIVHLYEEYGDRCVEHLRGMFGFAIWDSNERRLMLARDRLGIKPLYYHLAEDGSIYFGSEIKAVLASGAVDAALDRSSLPDYLANQAPTGEGTLYRDVKRLPAGHVLIWEDGRVSLRCYWEADLEPARTFRNRTDADLISEWRRRFYDAVESHLMADVPVGVLLSGGIDSTAIAAVMAERLPGGFDSYSVAFAEQEANELEFARIASKAYGTNHHELTVTPTEYFEALPRMIWHEDEPIAFIASIPLYFVCKLAQKNVKVVLTGEGSDELMAGYGRYSKTIHNLNWGARYERFIPAALREFVRYLMPNPTGSRVGAKLSRTFLCRNANARDLYFDNFSVFSTAMQSSILAPDCKTSIGDLDPYRHVMKLYDKFPGLSELNRLLYVDLKVYLQELLMKQDQMSMAASIESRVPFLDRELVEFTNQLPARLKLKGWRTKFVLREAMKDAIPAQILNRPKMGFPVPLRTWFRGRYASIVREFVLGKSLQARGLFDHRALETLVAEHAAGSLDHSQRLWSILNLELWLRQAVDGEHYQQATDLIHELVVDHAGARS